MPTVDQFLKALAIVESADNPEAWGDAGRAMGRWQVHPDALWSHTHSLGIAPTLGETWDQFVARVLRAIWHEYWPYQVAEHIAMYWHLGHWATAEDANWDARYAVRFMAALANAIAEMP
jgi:hypothetical protein